MIKELILAIILGSLLGLGVTGGYLALHKKDIKNNPSKQIEITTPTNTPATTISETPKQTSPISISSPESDALVSTDQITIKGTTSPNSLIIITTASQTFSDKSDAKGNFSVAIKLDSGINSVKISAIDQSNNQFDTSTNITYSTAKI